MSLNQQHLVTRRKFSQEEDQLIKHLYEVVGINDWKIIASQMPIINNRSAKRCKERYLNYLNPTIQKNELTINDDHLLLELIESYGKK
jgi:hypothetical protein